MKKLILFYGEPFTITTIFRIGIKILERLKSLHQFNILHNDLKPSNFCWGLFRNNKIELNKIIFVIDFGLASELEYFQEKKVTKNNYKKIKRNNESSSIIKKRRGNLIFMSFEVLSGKLPSKKTEMQSFSYMLINFFKLSLPWSNIKSKDYERKSKKWLMYIKKINDSILCKNLPYQISYIVSEINKLDYTQMPNYDNYIKALFYLMELDDNNDKEFFCWEKSISIFNNIKNKNKIKRKYERKFKDLFEGYYSF